MKNSKHFRSGFTLIELLVVIAIIGILASVVLASLNSARSKGADAKVQAQLGSMRSAAELYYTNHNNSYNTSGVTYDGLMTNACAPQKELFADVASGMKSLTTLSNYPAGTQLICSLSGDGTKWAVSASFADGQYWCVDSAGSSILKPSPSIFTCN